MPQEKDLKRLVRDRMTRTGERYTVARAALTGPGDEELRSARALVAMLADPQRAEQAHRSLAALQADLLRNVTVEGLRHPDWRVRRRCARLLDDLQQTDATIAALGAALRDAHPKVRAAAMHSLACEGCKPDGCDYDTRAIATSMLADPSAEVRRHAIASFWMWEPTDASLAQLTRLAADDPSARVRGAAADMLRHYEKMRVGEEARRSLPEDVQRKLEKHAGKWVAIADGEVIAADRFAGEIRRAVKGKRRPDAVVCRVPAR